MRRNSWVKFTSQATWLTFINQTGRGLGCIFYTGKCILSVVIASSSRLVFLTREDCDGLSVSPDSRCFEQPHGKWEVPCQVFFKPATYTMHVSKVWIKFKVLVQWQRILSKRLILQRNITLHETSPAWKNKIKFIVQHWNITNTRKTTSHFNSLPLCVTLLCSLNKEILRETLFPLLNNKSGKFAILDV